MTILVHQIRLSLFRFTDDSGPSIVFFTSFGSHKKTMSEHDGPILCVSLKEVKGFLYTGEGKEKRNKTFEYCKNRLESKKTKTIFFFKVS